MGHFTAVLDACVLYPAPLRSLLMYLAMTDLFRAKWTEDIHCGATKRQHLSLKNLPPTVEAFLESLERQGLAQTVAALRRFAELI